MSEIYLQGRTVGKFSLSRTSKGTTVARRLLEVETIRKIGRDRWQPEIHTLPIIAYSWLAKGPRGAAARNINHRRMPVERNKV